MEKNSKPRIVSFIIRFVQDQPRNDIILRPYRGAIRHIQTDEEVNFSNWEDAVDFIRRYVSIEGTL
jgi:hypothetical protein